jgi:hypothetical protein
MTLEEMKAKIYKLIEEYAEDEDNLTEDEDYAAKINDVINQIQNEVARIKKIPENTTRTVTEGQTIKFTDIAEDLYQLSTIKDVEYEVNLDTITFLEDGTARIFYYKYPKRITEDTEDDAYKFELTQDALEVIPYGVAADMLKSDVSSQYGAVYANRYREMLERLDPRYATQEVYINGGI